MNGGIVLMYGRGVIGRWRRYVVPVVGDVVVPGDVFGPQAGIPLLRCVRVVIVVIMIAVSLNV
jgi:hypothetical protein